ncbi:MAG: tRNA (adenosine(37)-N6)-dimethylallyltransferase MiaA, partial [Rikenellaceae bacterium]
YEIEALKLLEHLFETHDNIVAVGGSGLYIKALCEGLDTLPDSDPEVREAIRTQYANEGLEPLLAELQRFDPAFWEVVDRCNPSRVMRALEVCRSSGATYSELRKGEAKSRPFEIVKVGIDIPRNILYDRINRRVEIMVSEGLEAEARSVYHLRNLNSLQTVGYREMFDYFDGTATFEEAVELIKRNSRRYAKRQMTWFRRDADIQWFTTLDANDVIKHL